MGRVPPRQLHEFVFSDDRHYLFGKRPTSEPQATAREGIERADKVSAV